jgi:predicted Rossmann fold flavoprotein
MPQSLHIAIIGGGAAGFFAAIEAKRNFPHADITIFEKNSKVLAKVEITGGGRCNLTNSFEEISDLKQAYPRGHKLMKRLFKRFDYQHAFDWFEENGVPLVTQEDQCVFPQSQDSHSIIDCLVNTAKRLGVKIQCNHQLTAITELEDERLLLDFKTSHPVSEIRQIAFPLMNTTSALCQYRYGWSFAEAQQIEQVRKSTKPMLFIHGDKDAFVPYAMLHPLYEAKTKGRKAIFIAKGSVHAMAYRDHHEEYTRIVRDFVSKEE